MATTRKQEEEDNRNKENNDVGWMDQLETEIRTPREVALLRIRRHGGPCAVGDNNDKNIHQNVDLATRLGGILARTVDSFLLNISNSSQEHEQTVVLQLERTINILSHLTRTDPTLGEELQRTTCSALWNLIRALERQQPSNNLRNEYILDVAYELVGSCSSTVPLPFSRQEINQRLPVLMDIWANDGDNSNKDTRNTISSNRRRHCDVVRQVLIHSVTSRRQTAQVDVGFVLWPSSVVLARWLVTNPSVLLPFSNKNNGPQQQQKHWRILELGAGCGLVGCVAALLVKREQEERKNEKSAPTEISVCLTDANPVVLENLQRNVILNNLNPSLEGHDNANNEHSSSTGALVSVIGLDFHHQQQITQQLPSPYSDSASTKDSADSTLTNGVCSSGWVDTKGIHHEAVDIILAADIICQDRDALEAARTIHAALVPGGRAIVVCPTGKHRFGVDRFQGNCQSVGLTITAVDLDSSRNNENNTTNSKNNEGLNDSLSARKDSTGAAAATQQKEREHVDLEQHTSGCVEGMELVLFSIHKPCAVVD